MAASGRLRSDLEIGRRVMKAIEQLAALHSAVSGDLIDYR